MVGDPAEELAEVERQEQEVPRVDGRAARIAPVPAAGGIRDSIRARRTRGDRVEQRCGGHDEGSLPRPDDGTVRPVEVGGRDARVTGDVEQAGEELDARPHDSGPTAGGTPATARQPACGPGCTGPGPAGSGTASSPRPRAAGPGARRNTRPAGRGRPRLPDEFE